MLGACPDRSARRAETPSKSLSNGFSRRQLARSSHSTRFNQTAPISSAFCGDSFSGAFLSFLHGGFETADVGFLIIIGACSITCRGISDAVCRRKFRCSAKIATVQFIV